MSLVKVVDILSGYQIDSAVPVCINGTERGEPFFLPLIQIFEIFVDDGTVLHWILCQKSIGVIKYYGPNSS